MWNSIHLTQARNDLEQRERIIQRFAEEKMREYDGTVFLCVARRDAARRATFQQAAEALGYRVCDERALCTAYSPQDLATRTKRNVLFVNPTMQGYLGEYLDAAPAGTRHVLLYCRRGNGPSPHMSAFMDFWLERGVDILDLNKQ